METDGAETIYRIKRGGQTNRLALIEVLERELGAKRRVVAVDDYEFPAMVDGKKIIVATTGAPADYVRVSLARGEMSANLIEDIGKRFNAILATSQYDSAFAK